MFLLLTVMLLLLTHILILRTPMLILSPLMLLFRESRSLLTFFPDLTAFFPYLSTMLHPLPTFHCSLAGLYFQDTAGDVSIVPVQTAEDADHDCGSGPEEDMPPRAAHFGGGSCHGGDLEAYSSGFQRVVDDRKSRGEDAFCEIRCLRDGMLRSARSSPSDSSAI